MRYEQINKTPEAIINSFNPKLFLAMSIHGSNLQSQHIAHILWLLFSIFSDYGKLQSQNLESLLFG